MKRSSIMSGVSFDTNEAAISYWQALDTPRSLTCYLLLKYKEYGQLIELRVDPLHYTSAESFRDDYWATKLLSKFNGFDGLPDPKSVAISNFWLFEKQCLETNIRLDGSVSTCPVDVWSRIHRAREKIRSLLGDCDATALSEIFDRCSFGPGVTTSHKGKWLSLHDKFHGKHETTVVLDRVLERCLSDFDFPSWTSLRQRTTRLGNSIITVPKNSKTDRTIAVEPSINSFFQKGVGSYFRSKLKRWGVDLNNQTINQRLAYSSSMDGKLATIDMKAASDTISIECVRLLLPSDWVSLLEKLRSPIFSLDGENYRYSKHSSMGNGYTFELESLIFSACAIVCSEGTWSVYGDDIIIPVEAVDDFRALTTYLGFSVNESKSFSTTPFRESCGEDFFDGVRCSPFYLKKKDDVVQMYTFANWLRSTRDPRLRSVRAKIIAMMPRRLRFFIPPTSSLFGFHASEFEIEVAGYILSRRPYGHLVGYKIKGLRFIPATRTPPDREDTLASVLHLHEKGYISSSRVDTNLVYSRLATSRGSGRWVVASEILTDLGRDKGIIPSPTRAN